MLCTQHDITTQLNRRKRVKVVFSDLSKAFDIDFSWPNWKSSGVPSTLCECVAAFLLADAHWAINSPHNFQCPTEFPKVRFYIPLLFLKIITKLPVSHLRIDHGSMTPPFTLNDNCDILSVPFVIVDYEFKSFTQKTVELSRV